jgi:hypothetical protein
MCGHTKKDKVRNEIIREKVGVESIEAKMRENHLRWFGYIHRRWEDAPIRRIEKWRHDRLDKGRGRSKKIWMEVIKKDMSLLNLDENIIMNRNK